jgi:chitinase
MEEDCKTKDSDCGNKEADSCTAYVSSALITPVWTYSTTTVTSRCETVTACATKPTTVTSTVNKCSLNKGTISNIDYGMSDNPSITSFLDEQMSSFFASAFTTTTSTTTTETTASSTKTTSITPTPPETSYNCDGSSRCKYFPKMRAFCDMAKSFLKYNIVYK